MGSGSSKPTVRVAFETLAYSITPITSFNCYNWKWVEDKCPYVNKAFGQLERMSFGNRQPSEFVKEVGLSYAYNLAFRLMTYSIRRSLRGYRP